MSDSDELSTTTTTNPSVVVTGRKLRRDSSIRKKRCSLGSRYTIQLPKFEPSVPLHARQKFFNCFASSTISAAIDVANAVSAAANANAAHLTAESDSLNENLIQGVYRILYPVFSSV